MKNQRLIQEQFVQKFYQDQRQQSKNNESILGRMNSSRESRLIQESKIVQEIKSRSKQNRSSKQFVSNQMKLSSK